MLDKWGIEAPGTGYLDYAALYLAKGSRYVAEFMIKQAADQFRLCSLWRVNSPIGKGGSSTDTKQSSEPPYNDRGKSWYDKAIQPLGRLNAWEETTRGGRLGDRWQRLRLRLVMCGIIQHQKTALIHMWALELLQIWSFVHYFGYLIVCFASLRYSRVILLPMLFEPPLGLPHSDALE